MFSKLISTAIVAVVMFGIGSYSGYKYGTSLCLPKLAKLNLEIQEANDRIRQKELERAEAFNRLLEERRASTEQRRELYKNYQTRIEEYEKELANENDACILTQRDIDRMRFK